MHHEMQLVLVNISSIFYIKILVINCKIFYQFLFIMEYAARLDSIKDISFKFLLYIYRLLNQSHNQYMSLSNLCLIQFLINLDQV